MPTFTKRVDSDLNNGYFAGSWLSGGSLAGSWGTGKAPNGSENYGAARFTSVNIPQGVTINSAKITLTDSQNQSAKTIHVKIYGIAEDNTSDFSTDPDSRTKTTANATWDLSSVSQSTNTTRDTADLTSVVQEIINRAGWTSGNAMAFITDDNGTSSDNIFRWISYGGDSTKAALLTIDYTSPTTTSTTTTTSTSTSTSTTTTTTSTSTTTPGPELYGIKVYKL